MSTDRRPIAKIIKEIAVINDVDDLYVALCLVTWVIGCLAAFAWANCQITAGKSLPARLWWVERLLRYVSKKSRKAWPF